MSGAQGAVSPSGARGASPFSKGAALAIVLTGFAAFLAMLYFYAAGDSGNRDARNASAHAASVGVNGYAGLVRLLEAQGRDVRVSRSPADLETTDLLVIAPGIGTDPEELGALLTDRQYRGPTLVLLPKWWPRPAPRRAPPEVRDLFEEGWIRLGEAAELSWTRRLPAPYSFDTDLETLGEDESPGWSGLGKEGELPSRTIRFARAQDGFDPLVTDSAGHVLAFNVLGEEGSEFYENAHWTLVVVEPDLVNNWGMADPARAALALELVEEAGYGEDMAVVFDLTLNGLGRADNLLTLAFAPPFLAATLCLVLALLVIGWRAFMRFGASAARIPETGFGKTLLVVNGAGLIVRAKRMSLIARPYADICARRIAGLLGTRSHDDETIDEGLARRLPDEERFSSRAATLREARTPGEIMRAARRLDDLTRKLKETR